MIVYVVARFDTNQTKDMMCNSLAMVTAALAILSIGDARLRYHIIVRSGAASHANRAAAAS
jgi:hypothetical protein